MKNHNLDLSVCRINLDTGKKTRLYAWISTFEEAHLLAVSEMGNNKRGELVYISPGWKIEMSAEDIARVAVLKEKYEIEED